jgi:hypothetical protein
MANYNRIKGDYTLKTLNTGGNVIFDTSNVRIAGNISASGGITAGVINGTFFVGDGTFLSNVTANIGSASILQNGTSNVNIPSSGSNISFAVNSVGNVIVVSTLGANITTGTASTSNVTGALRVTGGVGVRGNVYADAVYSNNAAVLTANSVINGGTY